MGYWNAQQAVLLAAERGLNHRAARALVWMGLESLDVAGQDGAQPRLYFRGRLHLAFGLGFLAQHADSPTAKVAVQRAVKELTEAQCIRLTNPGQVRIGTASVYELLVTPKPKLSTGTTSGAPTAAA